MRTDIEMSQVSFLLLLDVNKLDLKINMIDFPYVKKGVYGKQKEYCLRGFIKFLEDLKVFMYQNS